MTSLVMSEVTSANSINSTLPFSAQMILTLSTEFVIYKMDPLIWTQSSPESESLDKEDLGILAWEASPKALFRGGGGYNLQQRHHACPEKPIKMRLNSNSFPFDPLMAQRLMITPLTEPFLTSDRYVR